MRRTIVSLLICVLIVCLSFGADPFEVDANTAVLYHFDEETGNTAYDATSNGLNGVLEGGTTWSSSGAFGSCIDINSGGVEVPDADALDISGQITVEAWIYPEAPLTGTSQVIIGKEGDHAQTDWCYYLGYGSNSQDCIRFVLGKSTSSSFWLNHPGQITLNEWHHIAGTYDGSVMRLYVDDMNNPVAEQYVDFTIDVTDNPFHIGKHYVSGYNFDGLIDEVRISDVVRYTPAPFPGEFSLDENTEALYHFNETSGSTAYDASGNNYHLSLQDGATWLIPGWNSTPSAANLVDSDAKLNSSHLVGNGWDAITYEAWIYAETFPGYNDEHPIIYRYDYYQGDPSFAFTLLSNGQLATSLYTAGGGNTGLTSLQGVIQTDTWHHVAVTWTSGETIKMFVDNMTTPVKEHTSTISGTIRAGSDPLRVGWFHDTRYGDFYFDGYIDEVRISNIARYPEYRDPMTIYVPQDYLTIQAESASKIWTVLLSEISHSSGLFQVLAG